MSEVLRIGEGKDFIKFDIDTRAGLDVRAGPVTDCPWCQVARVAQTAYRLIKPIREVGDCSQTRVLRVTTDKLAASPRVRAAGFFDIPYRY